MPVAYCRANSRLKWFHSFSSGMDVTMNSEIVGLPIAMTSSSGVQGPTIAETMMGYILAFNRTLSFMWQKQRALRRHGARENPPGGGAALPDRLSHQRPGRHERRAGNRRIRVHLAATVKRAEKVPVAMVGGFNDLQTIEEAVAAGKADLVALGRQYLADPDIAKKGWQGRADEV
jgi:hypothetical protein